MADTLTHGRVLKIAVPIVISNATIPILGVVDTGVIGQLGEAAPIGAVGIGALILSALYWLFAALRMGFAGVVAQAIGARDTAETDALLTRALVIGLAGGALLITLQLPLFWLALTLAPASAEVEGLAATYLAIRIWAAPAAIALFGITGWLIAHERTGSVLILQVGMNGLNILLDLWFVLGLGWGVEGVATATLIAEWTALGLGLWLCRAPFRGPHWRDWPRVFNPARLRNLATVNRDIMIRSALLETIFLSFLFLGARFGDVPLAANQILLQFLHVAAFALDGFAFAAETLVGQAMGARQRARLRRASIMAGQWGLASAVALSIAFAVSGPPIIHIMTTAPDVRAEAMAYLTYMILAPLAGVAPFILDGIFIGASRTGDMVRMMALSTAIYLIAIAALVPILANHGLWIALLISFLARGITLATRYPALEASASRT
ncbi:MAG: MATE family efflux transporter [Pseudomonadota bacterium]